MNSLTLERAEKLIEDNTFDVILIAFFLLCPDMDDADKMKEIFPKEWDMIFKLGLSRRETNIE